MGGSSLEMNNTKFHISKEWKTYLFLIVLALVIFFPIFYVHNYVKEITDFPRHTAWAQEY